MVGKSLAVILEDTIKSTSDKAAAENIKLTELAKQLASKPIKLLAAFFTAPILLLKIAISVKRPLRRWLAVFGIVIAIIFSYMAGTFLGSVTGALLIASNTGILVGLGFLIGTGMSVFLSVLCQILVLNAICFIFLKMNTEEVMDYLKELTADSGT